MTSLSFNNFKCVICSESSIQEIVDSTNAFGSPDLDTRPPEMERSTINTWIQRCPNCGYCNSDITKEIKGSSEIIKSENYLGQLNDENYPDLANEFLCYSIINDVIGDYYEAGWASVKAAWICDDEQNEDAAKRCRKRAIRIFNKVKDSGGIFAKQPGAEEAILIDLCRRSREFELASKLCNEALDKDLNEVIEKVIRLQALLIEEKDTGCYTIQQAMGITS